MTAEDAIQHRKGLVLVGLAALAWSTSGMFIRSIGADLMTMLFWRGLFSGAAVMIIFLLIERRRAWSILKSLRWPALLVAVLSASGMITGIGSMRYTTIAESMVIYATVPFMTAGLAYAFIGEKPSRSTLVASAVALAGVFVMLWGAQWGGSMIGKGLAVLMTLSMAGFTTVMRRHREVAMLPAMAASAWLCSFTCFWFADPASASLRDLGLMAMFGVMQNATGLALYTFGSKRIPAAEATLMAALEVPLTPLWVFVLFAETPAPQALLGGVIVLVALFGHILMEFRRNPDDDPEPYQASP